MGKQKPYDRREINASVYPDSVQPVHPGEYFVPPCEKPEPVSLWETCQASLDRLPREDMTNKGSK